jgi:hypothetical protein
MHLFPKEQGVSESDLPVTLTHKGLGRDLHPLRR